MSPSPINPHISDLLRFTETHLRHREALARATGEHFNIFDILRVGHLEVRTHSPVLAELLDPKGRHGQGPKFLDLFVTRFFDEKDNQKYGFDTKLASVSMEHHVGPVTDTSGGRLDIVISVSGKPVILIENKIYANDQQNQLLRYSNFAQDAKLFYLTLDGKDPEGIVRNGERTNFTCLSYSKNILSWLKDCRKEVV